MSKQARNVAIGVVVAAAAGYVAGILTAPKSGKETREDIKVATERGVQAAEKALKQLHTELNNYVDAAKVQLAKLQGRAKDHLETTLAQATKAKSKVREALSAAHDGEASDKDLKKAIDEAEKAVESLKAFLQK